MNKQLELLIEIQQIDSKILDKKCLIDEIPSKISEAESPLKDSLGALDKIKQRQSSDEKKKRDKEKEIDDINEKIKKLKARASEIKTNKEYQALLKEIESAEKERYAVEDEILTIMEEIENISREIKSEEIRFLSEKEKVDTVKKKLEMEKQNAEKEFLSLKEARLKIVDAIDKDVYEHYINLFESCKALAVIEAKREICMGCNMNIPPQLFVEIKKNDEIIHCPQCRRILYYKNT
ncbi:MAG: C4-type zinc ribbon domain-containing protein [Nitrospirota bacterium]